MKVSAYAALAAKAPLAPYSLLRREPGPLDVVIDALFCGVCHSDIHQARGEWGGEVFPMVPGHEVIGRVAQIGARVTRLKVGDLAGVGCMVDSCRRCEPCLDGREHHCREGMALTYNGTEMDRKTPTYGGYSSRIVVSEHFVLRVPESLDPAAAAPLLCAGITTYSPLRQYGVKAGTRVGVVGLGGLGHMAVKLAAAMGAEVTLFSTSPSKEADARRLGARAFVATKDPKAFDPWKGKLDLIVDTVSASHDLNAYLALLRDLGTMVLVGAPPEGTPINAFNLIIGNRRLAGSGIGGIRETQEMLDFCAEHRVVSDVELIPIQEINEAYERVLRSDVRYRFVVDLQSLAR